MINLARSAILFASVLAVGCVSNKSVFAPVSPSLEKGSVVYIYRPARASNVMLSPKVSVAGIKAFSISSGEYKQLYLSPGKHVIKLASTEGNTPAVDHPLKLVKGKVHYLRVDASMKLEFGGTYKRYQRKFELLDVLAEEALTEITSCKDMDGRVKKVKRVTAAEGASSNSASSVESADENNEDEAVFSIERTTNPFSH